MPDFAFFTLPDDGLYASLPIPPLLPAPETPPEPTVFGIGAALGALKEEKILGTLAADRQAADTIRFALMRAHGSVYGEELHFGGERPRMDQLMNSVLTVRLWRCVLGACSFCGESETPARTLYKGRGGAANCQHYAALCRD